MMNRMILLVLVFLCVYGGNQLQEQAGGESDQREKNREAEQKVKNEESGNRIRVILKTSDFSSIYHKKTELIQTLTGRVKVKSVIRSCGNPVYRGNVEVVKSDGGNVLINELPMEEYLYGVVGSEMPAGYEKEALKAQAVAARTYAYLKMQNPGYPEFYAHVDDSVSYQVYGNIEEKEEILTAVNETMSEVLVQDGVLRDIMYYSTSAGQERTKSLSSESEVRKFLLSEEDDLECEYPYYRWRSFCTKEKLDSVREIAEAKVGEIQSIRILERRDDGTAVKMMIKGKRDSIVIEEEYGIRRALASLFSSIVRQDGSRVETGSLLPSACIYIEADQEGNLNLIGGGYGHGCGMSQNRANEMAKKGASYREILTYFYPGVEIVGYE